MRRKGIIKILVGCILTILLMTSFSGVVEAAGPPHDSCYDEYGNQHKVWREKVGTGNDKQYEIFYQGKINGTWGNEIRLSFTNNDSIYPRIAYDLTLKILYITWLEEEGSNTTLYYCGSGDLGQTWTEMREYGILDYWAQRYHIEILSADNGTITVKTRWGNHEEYYHEIEADLDGDFIIDREDSDPFTYNFLGDIEYDYDVLTIDEELGVSVATKFKNFIGEVTIENVTFPEQEQMNYSHGIYVNIESTEEIEEAIIKMKSEEDYLMYTLEKHMYWRIVYAHGEQTGSYNNVSWARVNHFSTYTSGDPTSWDSDGDGLWDAEEIIPGSLILEAEDYAWGTNSEVLVKYDNTASANYVIDKGNYNPTHLANIENIGLTGQYDLLCRAKEALPQTIFRYPSTHIGHIHFTVDGVVKTITVSTSTSSEASYEWYYVGTYILTSPSDILIDASHEYSYISDGEVITGSSQDPSRSGRACIDVLAFIPVGEDGVEDGVDDGIVAEQPIFEAENHKANDGTIVSDSEASGGECVQGDSSYSRVAVGISNMGLDGEYDLFCRVKTNTDEQIDVHVTDYDRVTVDVSTPIYQWYYVGSFSLSSSDDITISANRDSYIDAIAYLPTEMETSTGENIGTDPLMSDSDLDGIVSMMLK